MSNAVHSQIVYYCDSPEVVLRSKKRISPAHPAVESVRCRRHTSQWKVLSSFFDKRGREPPPPRGRLSIIEQQQKQEVAALLPRTNGVNHRSIDYLSTCGRVAGT